MIILDNYNLLEKTPSSIIKYIKQGINGETEEAPKKINNCTNKIVSSNRLYREQLASFANQNGYKPIIISRDITGEAKDEAMLLIEHYNKYINDSAGEPLAIISGGETVVDMKGSGKGGRNQELALSFLSNYKRLETQREWLLLSVGTDGIDGPTDAAGGIIDTISVKAMTESKLDITSHLIDNNSYNFLKDIDSLYLTGPSGTNVADIQLMLIK